MPDTEPMTDHHTKSKGDLGVAMAHGDLTSQGWLVLFPATEHAPFDLVAYRNGIFRRVQVKYRAARACGSVYVEFGSSWSDRTGRHALPMNKAEVDVVCVYCPDTSRCYYLSPREFGNSVTLRVRPSANAQRARIWDAERFRHLSSEPP